MVAVSIFATIMTISMGSVLSILDANKKSQSLRAVMDNMNSTLESMTRSIRFGQNYHCGVTGVWATPQDCTSNGDTTLIIKDSANKQVVYKLDSASHQIIRSVDGVDSSITSPDVTITSLKFWVDGSSPYNNLGASGSCPSINNCQQPQVVIVVTGYAGLKPTIQSAFTLETTVSQRLFDFK